MAKNYHFSYRILEQAERMLEKIKFWELMAWENKELDADELTNKVTEYKYQINELSKALYMVQGFPGSPVAPWSAIQILKKYAAQRDTLDSMI
jgi:hypothetical protein